MADPATPHRLEGWAVRPGAAVLLVAGFFGALAAFIAGVALFYHLSTRPPAAPWPRAVPGPGLETAQQGRRAHLPAGGTGVLRTTGQQGAAISGAMRDLARRGDAGWGPPAPAQRPAPSAERAP